MEGRGGEPRGQEECTYPKEKTDLILEWRVTPHTLPRFQFSRSSTNNPVDDLEHATYRSPRNVKKCQIFYAIESENENEGKGYARKSHPNSEGVSEGLSLPLASRYILHS